MSARLRYLLLGALLVPAAVLVKRAGADTASPAGKSPVVVELFSSEGCSSCPSAEEFVRDFAARWPSDAPPLLTLEYHVDYWNYLGWTDPFSHHEYTERQEAYSHAFGDDRIYTPEIVVQGKTAVPSRSASALTAELRRESSGPLAHVTVAVDGSNVGVHVDHAPSNGGAIMDVVLAVTESNLRSEVRAGENRGETLAHAPVVRRLTTLGVLENGAFDVRAHVDLAPSWKRENLRFVAFVQERGSRHIVGAGYR
ncbi:MAG TPA: DUF1223 domain-containing protein [Polyangiaceae bacterium]|jgi:hypothetical protein|nr:DUF1223 domain-containing protein [Polyangiaceae bacterium]